MEDENMENEEKIETEQTPEKEQVDSRRNFLKSLALLGAATVVPFVAVASKSNAPLIDFEDRKRLVTNPRNGFYDNETPQWILHPGWVSCSDSE